VLTVEAESPASWTGDAIVTSLSAEMPADGAVTCSAEFAISGAFPFSATGVVQDEDEEGMTGDDEGAAA